MSTVAILEAFRDALGDPSRPEIETFEIPPAEAVPLAEIAIAWANRYAQGDARLGYGRDVRAVYALGLGVMLGAAAYRQAVEVTA